MAAFVFSHQGRIIHFQHRDNFPGESLKAMQEILKVGAAKGYLPGGWRSDPLEDHVKKARGHLQKLALGKDDGEDHLEHAMSRLMMAVAVRRQA